MHTVSWFGRLVYTLAVFMNIALAAPIDATRLRENGPERAGVVLNGTPVRIRPDADAPIVTDLFPRTSVIVRDSSRPGWMRLSSVTRYERIPDVTLKDGEASQIPDGGKPRRQWGRKVQTPMEGYIPASSVMPGDGVANLPLAADELVPLPSVWQSLGVRETRFVPVHPEQPPFSNIVRIEVSLLHGSKWDVMQYCSGALALRRDIVLTAGHCIDRQFIRRKAGETLVNDEAIKIEVFIRERGEVKLFSVARSRFSDHEEGDWAILWLGRPVDASITPLQLASPGSWLTMPRLELLTAGYSGDLYGVKQATAGTIDLPDLDRCRTGTHSMVRTEVGFQFVSGRDEDEVCTAFAGNSGGPLLLWNADAQAYQIVALYVSGPRPDETNQLLTRGLRDQLDRLSQTLQLAYPSDLKTVPGIGRVRTTLANMTSGINTFHWILARDLIAVLKKEGIADVQGDYDQIRQALQPLSSFSALRGDQPWPNLLSWMSKDFVALVQSDKWARKWIKRGGTQAPWSIGDTLHTLPDKLARDGAWFVYFDQCGLIPEEQFIGHEASTIARCQGEQSNLGSEIRIRLQGEDAYLVLRDDAEARVVYVVRRLLTSVKH
ncbi:S1 family peptidase [Burkholderiaceae bacterium DAT-1]|nr:S1 family peptidase [Burkholderiaceae bacterium DAT-1]